MPTRKVSSKPPLAHPDCRSSRPVTSTAQSSMPTRLQTRCSRPRCADRTTTCCPACLQCEHGITPQAIIKARNSIIGLETDDDTAGKIKPSRPLSASSGNEKKDRPFETPVPYAEEYGTKVNLAADPVMPYLSPIRYRSSSPSAVWTWSTQPNAWTSSKPPVCATRCSQWKTSFQNAGRRIKTIQQKINPDNQPSSINNIYIMYNTSKTNRPAVNPGERHILPPNRFFDVWPNAANRLQGETFGNELILHRHGISGLSFFLFRRCSVDVKPNLAGGQVGRSRCESA